ncbi:hypothetical protein M0R45_035785 [Rubus argutus]|uniref:Uncharacterized protein n=1 Tax=Rubus argutus TaxID=59490 RepID=A0AAW1VZF0_RUBAR
MVVDNVPDAQQGLISHLLPPNFENEEAGNEAQPSNAQVSAQALVEVPAQPLVEVAALVFSTCKVVVPNNLNLFLQIQKLSSTFWELRKSAVFVPLPLSPLCTDSESSDLEEVQEDMAANANRTLKELAAPDLDATPLCIEYDNVEDGGST